MRLIMREVLIMKVGGFLIRIRTTGFPAPSQTDNLGRTSFCPFLGIFLCSHTHGKHDGVGLALASPTHPEQTHITD